MALAPFFDDSYLYRRQRYLNDYFRAFDDQFVQPFEPVWLTPRWPTDIVEDLTKEADISLDRNRFQANIDVNQFKPEEISIKVTPDNTITVEGKHEEKQDEHGYISRHFVRKYVLPDNCSSDQVKSELSSDGVLTITAPRKESDESDGPTIQEIPVKQTGRPIRWLEEKTKRVKEELKNLKTKILG